MPGNESELIKFIFNKKNNLSFNHIGKINSIKIPRGKELIEVTSEEEIEGFSSSDSSKKADVYLNDIGVSVKQEGGKLFNKLYRKDLMFLNYFTNDDSITMSIIKNLEKKLKYIHNKNLKRDVYWKDIIEEKYFRKLLEYLMMKGKPYKLNNYPAKYILINKDFIAESGISVFNFNEYFKKYTNKIYFSYRRCWVGTTSSEHKRAMNICFDHKNSDNWCFKTITGEPRNRNDEKPKWRKDIPINERRTAYYLDITGKK